MSHKGFTLIELMIVVAIIGVLAAIGIPQYQNYVARSQVAEALSLATVVKTGVAEYYSVNGKLPPRTDPVTGVHYNRQQLHALLGIPEMERVGKLVRYMRVKSRPDRNWRALQIRLNNTNQAISAGGSISSKIESKTFYLIMDDSTGNVIWTCHCRHKTTITNCGPQNTILEKYLPSSCRP